MIRSLLTAAAVSIATTVPVFAEPLKFAVTDIEGLEALQQEFGAFEKKLEELSGQEIDLFPVSSRTAAVEALNQDKVDLVLTGPAEYVVINELTDAQIVTAWQRPDYFAQIVTLSDGPIKSVQDLKGKIVTFGSVGSTSQHLGPAQVLADFGLKYNVDYQPQIIGRNLAVEALRRGDVQAVGMNRSHLGRIREAFPDTSFTVVARGRDLPNDILVARSDLDADAVAGVKSAFVDHSVELMQAILSGEDNKKYKGGFFLTDVQDSDYNYVRSMYETIGVDTKSFVGN
ncbi:MAG: PhnD/SsuA/transferrin family substrate-binding protein [Rhodobacteraceae bacterium]|jgi:phosphonate transport system substrate-binding protein|nr:PhnD/SsuA/transferrin family substrate-binding protein [Paracoccaceae bacterium]